MSFEPVNNQGIVLFMNRFFAVGGVQLHLYATGEVKATCITDFCERLFAFKLYTTVCLVIQNFVHF